MNEWLQKLYETFIETKYYKMMLQGFGNTMLITLGALLIGVVIGTLIAVVKYYSEDMPALKPLTMLCDFYVTVIRGIPVVVLLLIFYFIVMASADGVTVAIITFGINSGAYVAEIVRSGIMSIDLGQMEAGRSLGLNYAQTMRYIIVPQAIKNILPALGNELITLVKETSIVMVISVQDLTQAAKVIVSKTYVAIVPYISLACIYLVIVIILEKLLGIFERRLRESDRR